MSSLTLLNENSFDNAYITDLYVDTIQANDASEISVDSVMDFSVIPQIQNVNLDSYIKSQISTTGALTYNNINGVIGGITIDNTNRDVVLSLSGDTILSADLSQTFLNRIDGLSGDIDILINEAKFFTGNGLNDVLMTSTGNLLISGTILTNNLIVSSNATFNNLFSSNIESTNATFTNLHSNNLDANKATFNNLFSSNIDANNIESNKATFNNLFSSNIDANNLESNKATFNQLYSNSLIINSNATFNNKLSTSNLVVSNGATLNGNIVLSGTINMFAGKTRISISGNRSLELGTDTAGFAYIDFNSLQTTGFPNDRDSRIISIGGLSGVNSQAVLNFEATQFNFNSNLSIVGNINALGISITNNATFGNNVSIGTLSTTNLVLNGNLLVSNNSTFSNNVSINTLSITNLSLNGNLFVSGFSTFDSDLVFQHIDTSITPSVVDTGLEFHRTLIGGTTIHKLRQRSAGFKDGYLIHESTNSGPVQFFSGALNPAFMIGGTTFDTIDNSTALYIKQNQNSTATRLFLEHGTTASNANRFTEVKMKDFVSDYSIRTGGNANNLLIRNNNTSLDSITISAGNVGIGTQPTTRLDVFGRTRIRSLSAGDASAVIEFTPNNGTTNFLFVNNSNTLVSTAPLSIPALSQAGSCSLAVNGNHFFELSSGNNTAFIDFHSVSGSTQDFDGRIRCIGGTASTSQRGDMSYLGNQHTFATPATETVVIDNKSNMGLAVAPRCRLDVRINNDAGGDNPVLILDNNSNTNNTTKNVLLQFRGTDTVGTNKDLGGIRYTPNDANFVNGSTLIQGRRSDATLTSLQMNHQLQEFTFRPGGATGINPSIYLNGKTNSGEQGVRIHYDATTGATGGARIDMKANIIGQTIRFRADTTNGLTDIMRLEQGGNCVITNNLTVGVNATITNQLTVGSLPAIGTVDVFHAGGTLGIQSSDIRTKKDVETFENELDDIWKTIKPIKYLYKTKIANQVNEKGQYRKTYGINASLLHPNVKQIIKNTRVELCEACQSREEGLECYCDEFEKIDCANYCSRDIMSITIAKIKQLENTIDLLKGDLTKERIQYKLTKEKQEKKITELGTTLSVLINKLKLQGLRTN